MQNSTQNFRFKTTPKKEGEKAKEFILTFDGQDLIINTRGNFISIVDFETARLEVSKKINLKGVKK